MDKKSIVRKHNDVTEACYNMSVSEMRIILSCVAQINFEQIIDEECPFYISAMDYSRLFGVKTNNVYAEMKKAVNDLWNREITIKRENEPPLDTRWIQAKARYGNGGVEIHFASTVIPYLVKLHENGNYTMYELGNVGGLKSVYGIRLYELLVQYKAIGERTIKIKYLREILCLGAKYKAMKDFKKYIIESAMKEINEQTDLRISYENIKRGRSIISLHFTIKARRRTEIAPNNPKKYLSAEAINTEFQKPRFRRVESYQDGFKILKKEGYTLDVNGFLKKYMR